MVWCGRDLDFTHLFFAPEGHGVRYVSEPIIWGRVVLGRRECKRSDYCDIDPRYGTLEDFDNLVKEAGKRSIKVLYVMLSPSNRPLMCNANRPGWTL